MSLPIGRIESGVRAAEGVSNGAVEYSRDTLRLWMGHMRNYGVVWHEDIGRDLLRLWADLSRAARITDGDETFLI